MRSTSYKSKSNDKFNNSFKVKAIDKTDKKHHQDKQKQEPANKAIDVSRPGSCPANNSAWIPSRNWHKYLSSTVPSPRPRAITTHRPKPELGLVLSKPPDELLTVKLPTVNFCSGEEPEAIPPTKRGPSFSDLCDDDKRKIAQLVQELARCKQEKQEDEETITMLKKEVSELKSKLKSLSSVKNVDGKPGPASKTVQNNEQTALKKQLEELNQLLLKMQVQKATSDVQVKTITERAEKMTRALHVLHRENTELKVEVRLANERLSVAHQSVDKVSKELKSLQDHIKPQSEDKACQSSENIAPDRVCVKTIEVEEKVSQDQQILTELFFNKAVLQNRLIPKETIIFLPSDYKDTLPKNV